MLRHILAQQRTVKVDVSGTFLYLRCTVDYCGRVPAFRVTAIGPKILASSKAKAVPQTSSNSRSEGMSISAGAARQLLNERGSSQSLEESDAVSNLPT